MEKSLIASKPAPASRQMDDVKLWAAAQRGDTEAFGRLFDRHADVVYRYASLRLRRNDLAEDVVSTAFGEAWRQRDRIDLRDGSLLPWLLGVARNQANRQWRQQARLAPLHAASSGGLREADFADGVASRLDAPAELRAVTEALARLPEGAREVLVLSVWGQLTHEQIAAELEISVGTVKSRLSRARSRLSQISGTSTRPASETAAVIRFREPNDEGTLP